MPNLNAGKKIKSADIGKYPKNMFDEMPRVTATYEDGTTEVLFSYYPDEIWFGPHDFNGLTREEAFELKRKKDVQYLQSS
jgi:hypothetical protein